MTTLSLIQKVLKKSSLIANDYHGNVSSTVKSTDNNQVLTEADLKIGKTIISEIEEHFPDHNLIDEEAGIKNKGSQYTWVVDPIDGTSNFAAGLATYGIMVGLLKDTTPLAGGLALPYFNEIYLAERGKGCTLNGKKVSVTSESNLANVLVAYGIDGRQADPEFTRQETQLLAEIILRIRNLRSTNSVYDTAQVITGRYGAFLNRTCKIWDNVAQHILIEEAGGIYTDFFGEPIDYSSPLERSEENFSYLTSNPELHKQLLKIIKTQTSD